VKAKLKLSPSAWVGAIMIGTFIVIGIIGPWIAPYDLASKGHWFGTDSNGRDALSQLLFGARRALMLSGIVVAITSVIGILLGTIAGWFRGWVDEILMRFVDILLAFPGILLNIAIVATVANPGLGVVILALSANGWVGYARVARGQVLALREREFITAAVALGASNARVIGKHLLPNVMGPALIQMSFGLGGVILIEAALSFLGLGPQVDYTWGSMLDQARNFLWKGEWVKVYALVPGLAITWVVLGANLLGDGLRDRFDPRNRGRS
jgi:peptide/nickel transport system permease protein